MRYFVLAAGFLVSGCAAPSTTLVNDQGGRVHCASSGFGVIGTTIALASYQNCLDVHRERGFRVPGSAGIATSALPSAAAVVPVGNTATQREITDREGKYRWVLPSGWVAQTPPAAIPNARFYVREPVIDAMAFFTTVNRSDVQDLRAHVASVQDGMRSHLTDARYTPIESVRITGRSALRFEASGVANGIRLHYVFTAIEGATQIMKVMVWMPESQLAANRARLDILMDGLTEISSTNIRS